MNGETVFKAIVASGFIESMRELDAAEKAQAYFAVSGEKFRLLPEKLKDACDALAAQLTF